MPEGKLISFEGSYGSDYNYFFRVMKKRNKDDPRFVFCDRPKIPNKAEYRKIAKEPYQHAQELLEIRVETLKKTQEDYNIFQEIDQGKTVITQNHMLFPISLYLHLGIPFHKIMEETKGIKRPETYVFFPKTVTAAIKKLHSRKKENGLYNLTDLHYLSHRIRRQSQRILPFQKTYEIVYELGHEEKIRQLDFILEEESTSELISCITK